MQIKWLVSKPESLLIERIARRASKMAQKGGVEYPIRDAAMDIIAVHANGSPLRLAELAQSSDFDFAHDVFGIRGQIDRTTGTLPERFSPRFAA